MCNESDSERFSHFWKTSTAEEPFINGNMKYLLMILETVYYLNRIVVLEDGLGGMQNTGTSGVTLLAS